MPATERRRVRHAGGDLPGRPQPDEQPGRDARDDAPARRDPGPRRALLEPRRARRQAQAVPLLDHQPVGQPLQLGDLRPDRPPGEGRRDPGLLPARPARRRSGRRAAGSRPAVRAGSGSPRRRSSARSSGRRARGTAAPTSRTAPRTALPKISFWSIWNEPNYGIDLAPQATNHNTVEVSAQQYRGLADNAWNALQATHHDRDTILIGETAPHGTNSPRELLRDQAAALAPGAVLRRLQLPTADRLGRPGARLPDDLERDPRASPRPIRSCSRPAASPPTSTSRASRRIS